jgi:hypothetical protein
MQEEPLLESSSTDRGATGRSLAFAGLGLALLAGCLSVATPKAGAPARPTAAEGIVFGRVRVFDRGQEITPWKVELAEILAEDPILRLALFNVERERRRPAPISPEGRFGWILPSGTYLIYHTPSIDPPFNEPLAAFQVAGGSGAVDLGELHLAVSVDRPLSWSLASYTLSRVEALAAHAGSADWFLKDHPGTSDVRRGAFVVDPELGGLFTRWSPEACARILARHGIDMDSHEKK